MTRRSASARRVAARRRVVFASGITAIVMTVAAALALGTGCIFDDGSGYQGGGRRGTQPTSSESLPSPSGANTSTSSGSPTSSSTTSSTSTSTSPPPDGSSLPQDAGGN